MLKYLKHNEINKEQWDNCVDNAINPLIYNTTTYLDIIHPGWDALVYENSQGYAAVMPLLNESKLGILLHPKPILAQQLGITCRHDFDVQHVLENVVNQINGRFRIVKYPFNYYNTLDTAECYENIRFDMAKTQVLALNQSYNELYNRYRRDRKARLKQAMCNDLCIQADNSAKNFISLFTEYVSPKIYGGVNEVTLGRIKEIVTVGLKDGWGQLISVNNHSGDILSIGYFTLFHRRATYLFAATSDEGKALHANTLLLDHFIRQNAGLDITLDFEGSPIDGINDFYKSFGAKDEAFYVLKKENAPPIYKALSGVKKKINQLLN